MNRRKKATSISTESTSTGSGISTTALEMIVEHLRCQKNRSTTRRNYFRIWRKFNNFILSLDRKPDQWEDRLILFLGYLINEGRKASTIKSYISAIKSVLQEIRVENQP